MPDARGGGEQETEKFGGEQWATFLICCGGMLNYRIFALKPIYNILAQYHKLSPIRPPASLS